MEQGKQKNIHIRSFVKRSRKLTKKQKESVDNLYAKYELRLENGEIDFEKIFGRKADTILEIGFGTGESLFEMAKSHPHENYIGVEVYLKGLGNLMELLENYPLPNLRIYVADAILVLKGCIPNRGLKKILLFFPDPWPKRRHHKRRIVQPEFVNLIGEKLKSDGLFYIATDWKDYADHILRVMRENRQFKNISKTDLQKNFKSDRVITKFELRGKNLGHEIYNFIFMPEIL